MQGGFALHGQHPYERGVEKTGGQVKSASPYQLSLRVDREYRKPFAAHQGEVINTQDRQLAPEYHGDKALIWYHGLSESAADSAIM